jgi:hypothetical protein
MRGNASAQVFTVFGGAFVAEAHDHIRPRKTAAANGPTMAVVMALLLGTATTAGAITAVRHIHSTGYGVSYQTIPVATFESALY